MYPDRVGRVVIDGVYDSHNYRGSLWNTNLHDSDAVLSSFFDFCHQAGPDKCPLYASSAAEVRSRFENALHSLEVEPIALSSAIEGPTVITKKNLVSMTFAALYSPLLKFPDVASAVLAVESRNESALVALRPKIAPPYECNCGDVPLPWSSDNEAFNAIACGDGDAVTYNAQTYKEYFTTLERSSAFAAQLWGVHYLQCTEWNVRPKWRYTGPLDAVATNGTAHPLLVVSPTYDPVCPLSDAQKVVKRYPGAALLVQDSYGHCSPSAPSLCTAKHIRAYFEQGILPEEGTVCTADELPFVGLRDSVFALSAEDEELLSAMKSLGESLPLFGNF